MTADSETASPSSSAGPAERLITESPTFATLRAGVAAALLAQAPAIAARWAEQSRTVALRESAEEGGRDEAGMTAALVAALAESLCSEGATSDALVALGLEFGVTAFAQGSSLHHALKGLGLLSAMSLYAVEASIGTEAGATAADGVRVSRRLQQASSLLTLAATKGYTQAMGEAMRDRFRHLRHDLRNPLGTIKSVLAMMDDETMPAEARAHPRFRAMAKRNARSLGELIADRLSDAEAIVPALAQQSASLRTIACGVRRDLRAKAAARGATVTVGGARSRVTVDAAGLELVLHELLSAALNEAAAGDELSVEFGEMRDEHVPVTVLCAPARRLITTDVLERLAGLTARMGATLEAGDQAVVVLVPVRRTEITIRASEVAASVPMTADVDGAPPAAESISGSRDPGYDVRGSGEREYGQSGRL